jgi:hypothetical protein
MNGYTLRLHVHPVHAHAILSTSSCTDDFISRKLLMVGPSYLREIRGELYTPKRKIGYANHLK